MQTYTAMGLDSAQLDQREPQPVGSVGAAAGEYADLGIATQAGRAHQGRPAFRSVMEEKRQPQVAEGLEATHGEWIVIGRIECQDGACTGRQARLARNTELVGKVALNNTNGLQYIAGSRWSEHELCHPVIDARVKHYAVR